MAFFTRYCNKGKVYPGPITATHKVPKHRHTLTKHVVRASLARYIADRQPLGAIIHWQDPKCEFAKVYSQAIYVEESFSK